MIMKLKLRHIFIFNRGYHALYNKLHVFAGDRKQKGGERT